MSTISNWPSALLVENSIAGQCFARDLAAHAPSDTAELRPRLIKAEKSRLAEHAVSLRCGTCMPIGSPAFMRACLRAAGIAEPSWESCPRSLTPYMPYARVTARTALKWTRPVYIRPAEGTPYEAFVLRRAADEMTPWDNAQFERFLDLPGSHSVWVCAELPIASEWCYYVLNGAVLGYAPVDLTGEREQPELGEISSIIAAVPDQGAFALDVAVLKDGSATLLRVLDAWKAEYYPFGSCRPDPLEYLQFLAWRWREMLDSARRAFIDQLTGNSAQAA
jgi:hypothetical protein